jgi:uncharacterized membrane protein YbhN (UPF0104 family)
MKHNRWLAMGVVLAIVVALAYVQARTLQSFQWDALGRAFDSIVWWHLAIAIALIYAAYVARAFRWSVFLRRSRPATPAQMIPAQFIGYAAIAILGRLGEFVRPYLVARRQRLTFTSQLGVYTVERVFDLLASATIIAVTLSVSASVRGLEYHDKIRTIGYLGIAAAVALALLTVAIRVAGPRIAGLVQRWFTAFSPKVGNAAGEKVLAFSRGLDAIGGWPELAWTLFYSFLNWGLIVGAYVEIVHSFRIPSLATIPAAQTVVLMAASMVGSVLQLPVVGGGSQMATIQVLISILKVDPEAATACGLTLFAITFLAVIPAGLIFARVEQVSLGKIAKASEAEGQALEAAGNAESRCEVQPLES